MLYGRLLAEAHINVAAVSPEFLYPQPTAHKYREWTLTQPAIILGVFAATPIRPDHTEIVYIVFFYCRWHLINVSISNLRI